MPVFSSSALQGTPLREKEKKSFHPCIVQGIAYKADGVNLLNEKGLPE